ncbi:type II secretion system F family protein [Raoultibacter timonensis]|uniref:type II secretion system F family protein n=1 Tax=Raoultibacter timonensis TaxID=1907662 RepID=UPI000C83009F|nr:type II secretion system F family protein [Raoultibacter timonensis]
MARPPLKSSALSVYCESVAIMLSAGIQTDEAVHMLGENLDDTEFKSICDKVYAGLIAGKPLAASMDDSQAFPSYAVDMVAAGEQSGRLENALRSLAVYYDEEARLFDKIRSNVGYPAALLCVMSVVLAFTVITILPVFINAFESLSGNLTSGSFAAVNVSIIIGWAALIVTLVCAVIALAGFFLCRSASGRISVLRAFERLPFTKSAMYQLALSRFTSALSTYIASGIDTDTALKDTLTMVDHQALKVKLESAYQSMIDPSTAKSLPQAIRDSNVFEPLYARMLSIGSRSGGIDHVLNRLSTTFFDDAIVRIDSVVDSIEPALAAFLTIAVGATLISVMLPLIGIMGSIG